ncbi:MAG: NAD-dependent DNA ligase LigA [Buchnera aphidicola (Eriosoma harunire)]
MNNLIKKIYKLRQKIHYHNYLYYTLNDPVISDLEYDILMQKLCDMENQNKNIVSYNSPSQSIQSILSIGPNIVTHLTPMLSLNHINDVKELILFEKRIKSQLLQMDEKINFCCELKFDGVAVNLIYYNGILQQASTRGNGICGENVIDNIKTIKSIPIVLQGINVPELLEVRGEIIMLHQDFINLNTHAKLIGEKVFSNPRNAAAGSLRHTNTEIVQQRNLCFLSHSIGMCYPNLLHNGSHFLMLKQFINWGLPVHKIVKLYCHMNDILIFYHNINSMRSSFDFDIDGIVVKLDSLFQQQKIGNTRKSPRWAMAIKFRSKTNITLVSDIRFEVGRTGIITPIAFVNPIKLGGVVVKKVSLYNKDEMYRLGICIGDRITLCRSGDVIPKIISVDILYRKKHGLKSTLFPIKCPSCDSKIVHQDKNVLVRCNNDLLCKVQIKKRLVHFFSKKAVYVRGLGMFIINQLVDIKNIHTPVDVFNLTKSNLVHLNKIGPTSINKLMMSLNHARITTLSRFLYALGIRDVGEGVANCLSQYCNNIDNFLNIDLNSLLSINHIGNQIAINIFNFISEDKNKVMMYELKKILFFES